MVAQNWQLLKQAGDPASQRLIEMLQDLDAEVQGGGEVLTALGVKVLGGGSSGAAYLPDGTKLYVTNSTDHTVSVVDPATFLVLTTITSVALTGSPQFAWMAPDGSKLYIPGAGIGAGIVVIDPSDDTIVGTVAADTDDCVAFTPDSAKAYASWSGGVVRVIDVAAGTVTKTITVGTSPAWLTITPDGAKVYVMDSTDAAVYVIDTVTDTVVTTIPCGVSPFGGIATATKVYVEDGSTTTISVIDVATDTVTGTLPLTECYSPAMAVTPDGARVLIPCLAALVMLDVVTDAVVAAATVPGLAGNGIAVAPDGKSGVCITTGMVPFFITSRYPLS